jgi:hypothetical protein
LIKEGWIDVIYKQAGININDSRLNRNKLLFYTPLWIIKTTRHENIALKIPRFIGFLLWLERYGSSGHNNRANNTQSECHCEHPRQRLVIS